MTIAVTEDRETCFSLRRRVFIEEQGFPLDLDDYDTDAIHLLAREGDTPVGTARVVISDDTAKIGRVCVLPAARGTGLGSNLIRAAMDVARTQPGVRRVRLNAQVRAMGFYERLGFAADGVVEDVLGVRHCDMAQAL